MTNILHAVKGGLLSYCDKVYSRGNINQKHRISGVMIFVASPLSTQHYRERAKIGWLGIRIMCPNGVTFLPADCCYSELAL